jgi:hypothetical protein
MAWRKHHNQLYFYRSQRVDGRRWVVYLGNGEAAHQAAAEIEARKQARDQQHALEERQDAATAPLLDLSQLADLLLETTLLNAGYHYYQRHWRRKRVYRNPRNPQQDVP